MESVVFAIGMGFFLAMLYLLLALFCRLVEQGIKTVRVTILLGFSVAAILLLVQGEGSSIPLILAVQLLGAGCLGGMFGGFVGMVILLVRISIPPYYGRIPYGKRI